MKQNNKGFSLLELIASIAIMAVLSGMLAPQFFQYIEKARETRDMQTLHIVYTAVQAALSDDAAYEALCESADVESAAGDSGDVWEYCDTLEHVLENGEFGEEVEEVLGVPGTVDLQSKKAGNGVVCIRISGEDDGGGISVSVYSGKASSPEKRVGSLDSIGAAWE